MQDQLSTLRGHAASAWRSRWYGIGCAWLLCIAGWTAVSMLPNVYESRVRLYVDADAVLTPLLRGLALDSTVGDQLDLMQRTLLSRPNLETVISRTRLDLSVNTAADRENLVNRLGEAIKVIPQERNLFTISYRNKDPQLAYDVVQAIMGIFIESRSGSTRSEMDNAKLFLDAQIASREQDLRTAERSRADFRAKYLDLLPADGGGASNLDAARSNSTALNGELNDALARQTLLQTQLGKISPAVSTGGGGGGGSRNGAAIADEQRKLDEMLLTETDSHPDVERERHLIEMLRSSDHATAGGGSHGPSESNPAYAQLTVELIDTEANIASLKRKVADATAERDRLEGIMHSAPGLQAQYLNLNRDYDALRVSYAELVQRRESMRLAAAADDQADKVKLRVVDPAQISGVPVSPPRVLLTFVVLLAGLGGGAMVAVGLSQLDGSFGSIDELLAMGLPVIGGVSLDPARIDKRRKMIGIAMSMAAVLLLCIVCGGLIFGTLLIGASA